MRTHQESMKFRSLSYISPSEKAEFEFVFGLILKNFKFELVNDYAFIACLGHPKQEPFIRKLVKCKYLSMPKTVNQLNSSYKIEDFEASENKK